MKTFKKLFLFLLVVSAASCDVGDDEELNYGNGAYVAQFPEATQTGYFLKDNAETFDYNLPVQIVGGNGLALSSDTTVTFEIDTTTLIDHDNDENTPDVVATNAVEGVNFDFTGSNTFVIPAGSTFGTIPIKVYSGTLDDQDPPRLLLKLVSADAGSNSVVTSGNKGSLLLTMQAQCISDLAGNYSNSTVRITPAGGPYTANLDVFSATGTGEYRTSFVGNYYIPGTLPTAGAWSALDPSGQPGYTFLEVCGRVRVENQQLASIYSNNIAQTPAQYAASTVNPTTGVIVVEYSIFFTNNTVERPFRSTYTPIP